MKIYYFFIILFIQTCVVAQVFEKKLFSDKELEYLKSLKVQDFKKKKIKRVGEQIKAEGLVPFYYAVKNDQAYHRKAMSHKLSGFYQQLDEVQLYKSMYQKFLHNVE